MTQKRRKSWSATPSIQLSFTGNATVLGGALSFGESGVTIMRMMGEYGLSLSAAPTAVDQILIAVGLGVISTDAFNLGATAVPDPAGEPEYPWLYWAQHSFEFSTASLDPNAAIANLRHSFDVKSMRKMGAGQSLAWIAQYVNVIGNPSVRLHIGQTRMLLALP